MELGKAITSELDPDNLLPIFLDKISELIPAQNWSLLLYDKTSKELSFRVSNGLDIKKLKTTRLALGEGIAGSVAATKQPMVVPDVKFCEDFSDRVDRLTGFCTKSIIAVPLLVGNETVGVIEAVNPSSTGARALGILTVIADYAAIAVENMRRYEEIQTMAHSDNLTGLYNTRYFYRALKSLITKSKASNRTFSLIFMDLDNFKNVVDTYGHLNGSQAIKEVARTIRDTLREPEYGVSYGGDEFVVVLPGYNKIKALWKAEEIRHRMMETEYLSGKGHRVKISASFGVACYPEDATDFQRLLSLADRAMFRVKDEGKNAVAAAVRNGEN